MTQYEYTHQKDPQRLPQGTVVLNETSCKQEATINGLSLFTVSFLMGDTGFYGQYVAYPDYESLWTMDDTGHPKAPSVFRNPLWNNI
jgi:hypothetical protein